MKTPKKVKDQGILRWTYIYLCAVAEMPEDIYCHKEIRSCAFCAYWDVACDICPIGKGCGYRLRTGNYRNWSYADINGYFKKARFYAERILDAIERVKV